MFVAGACEVPVASLEECLHYLELGEQNRCRGGAGGGAPGVGVAGAWQGREGLAVGADR